MPCDGVILKRKTLRVLESHVTGCNEPVLKRTREEALSIGCPYFECILFSGTVIITGFAEVFVCNTGKNIFDPTNELVKKQNGEDVKILKKARNVSKQLSLLLMVFSKD